MVVGCYHLHLYCDQPGCTPAIWNPMRVNQYEVTDEHGSTCRLMARKRGWILRKDGTAICPDCAKKSGTSAS
jgi:hypothetical protein